MKSQKLRKALLLVVSALLLMSLTVVGTIAYLTDETDQVKNTFTVGNVKFDDDPALNGGLDEEDVDEYGVDITGETRVKENEYKLLPNRTYIKDPTLHISMESEACYVRAIVTVTDFEDLYEIVTAGMTAEEKAALKDEEIAWLISKNVGGYSTDVWTNMTPEIDRENDKIIYEFRVKEIVVPKTGLYVNGVSQNATTEWLGAEEAKNLGATDAYDIVLFETINVPGNLSNEQLATLADEYETTTVENADGTTTTTTTKVEDAMQILVEAHLIQAEGFNSADEAWAAFTK